MTKQDAIYMDNLLRRVIRYGTINVDNVPSDVVTFLRTRLLIEVADSSNGIPFLVSKGKLIHEHFRNGGFVGALSHESEIATTSMRSEQKYRFDNTGMFIGFILLAISFMLHILFHP